MTPPYRKKLIEVALPLKAINEASAREKSIRHGHPSTLHLWWARRPLAACRAVLFASLVDDPDSDPQFRNDDGSVDEDAAATKRAQLFSLIEELVQWENSNNPEVIRSARAEIARCVASRKIELGELARDHELAPGVTVGSLVRDCWVMPKAMGLEKLKKGKKGEARIRYAFGTTHLPPADVVNAFLAEHAPPVLDPFAGGGSIPLEAQRLGLRAYASDLNPVAVLINKALIEIPPKFAGRPPVNPKSRKDPKTKAREWRGAEGLAEDVRYYGRWMRDEAEKRIGHLYPTVTVTADMARDRPDLKRYVDQELTVIAWLWARTVQSPNPALSGAYVPLVKSFALSKKKGRHTYIKPKIDVGNKSYSFEVRVDDGEVPEGTVARNVRKCLFTGDSIPLDYVREQGRHGNLGSCLIAIVAEGDRGRVYISPLSEHVEASVCDTPAGVPDAELPRNARYMTPTIYGMSKHRDLYTQRQLNVLTIFADLVTSAREQVLSDFKSIGEERAAHLYADAVGTYLAFGIGKLADRSSALCGWDSSRDTVRSVFARQAISMTWDYAESNPFSSSSGNFEDSIAWGVKCLANSPESVVAGSVLNDTATCSASWPKDLVISTDPPYYDNVPYADLSDFFYVWLRLANAASYPKLFSTLLVPKQPELVADPIRQGGKAASKEFFEQGMRAVLTEAQAAVTKQYPTTIYYAFKQAEGTDDGVASTGWETFLQGLIDTGWQIQGTWPIRTELATRTRNMGSNALASSIVLACRTRSTDCSLATRREFLNTLKQELPDALRHLQLGNIAPVDLAQAAIGPGMAVFTRYARVMEASGEAMTVRTALALINQTLDEVLAEQEGEFDADTRWAIAWFEEYGVDEGPYGTAETLSRAKNTAVEALREAGIVKSGAGKVRLLARDELPDNWDPQTDTRLRHWEVVQHLIRALETDGELGAAKLLRKLGSAAEPARDLAYRLYSLCERKKWASEALAYNGLVTAWPEISKLARAERPTETQQTFA